MFSSVISLTMTATLIPSLFRRTFLRKDVLPEPKKPEMRVTGIGDIFFILFLDVIISKKREEKHFSSIPSLSFNERR